MMVELLKGVVDEPGGTAGRLRFRYKFTNEIGGKTGTTQNQSDGWFMGITPNLVTGVWVGCSERQMRFRSIRLGQGANMALLDAMALSEALRFEQNVEIALHHYAQARRWHVRLYQAMSWAFTPQYQSDSKILPILRDRALFPLSQIGPVPRILTRLVCGNLIPPLGSLTTKTPTDPRDG